MFILARPFGPSKHEVWAQLADHVGGKFTDAGWLGVDDVRATVGEWTVTLDTRAVGGSQGSSTTYTRMRAPYLNKDGFRFTIYRAGLFTPIGRLLGLQDVAVGDSQFDRDFVIQGNDEAKLRSLFDNDRIKELFRAQPSIRLHVHDGEGWFRNEFPDGVDELYFEVAGVIRDIERLRLLFDLFSETLNQLCHIDSAYEDDPDIKARGEYLGTVVRAIRSDPE